jgi:hypothetical protein
MMCARLVQIRSFEYLVLQLTNQMCIPLVPRTKTYTKI